MKTPTEGIVLSAFLLIKLCPAGGYVNIYIDSERELHEHMEAMWRVTPEYHVVAVIPVPKR